MTPHQRELGNLRDCFPHMTDAELAANLNHPKLPTWALAAYQDEVNRRSAIAARLASTATERRFRVQPIGGRYQVQHALGSRWVWGSSIAHETPREARAEAFRLAARWLRKTGNTATVED